MAATRFSTQRPRLPIRPPIHYGVYLAPLQSCPTELLPLPHCNGIVTASGLGENIPSPENDFAKFERTLLEFHEFNFPEIFRVVRALPWLSNAVKNRKSVDSIPSKRRPKYAKLRQKAKFQTPISRAIRFNGPMGVRAQNPKLPHPQFLTHIARIPRI